MFKNSNFRNESISLYILKSIFFTVVILLSGTFLGQYDSTNVFIEVEIEELGFDLSNEDELIKSNYVVNLMLEEVDNISSIHITILDVQSDSTLCSHSFIYGEDVLDEGLSYEQMDDMFYLGMGEHSSLSIIRCDVVIEQVGGAQSPAIRYTKNLSE